MRAHLSDSRDKWSAQRCSWEGAEPGPSEGAASAPLPPSRMAGSERCHCHFGRTLQCHAASPAWGESDASSNSWRHSPAMGASHCHRGSRPCILAQPSGDCKQHPHCSLAGTLSQNRPVKSLLGSRSTESEMIDVHGYRKPRNLGTILFIYFLGCSNRYACHSVAMPG